MACTKPLRAWCSTKGGITFKRQEAYVDRPLEIACKQCMGCRVDTAREWATRCLHEAQTEQELGNGSSFLTLTYSEEHLPKDWGLHVSDLQDFFKRLRKCLKGKRISYYAVGEYGERTLRPHWHVLLFGEDFAADRIPIGMNEHGDRKYISPWLQRAWGKGQTELGAISSASATYVTKYVTVRKTGKEAERAYSRSAGEKRWRVRAEFAVMSKRPGIGKRWFDRWNSDVYPADSLRDGAGRRQRTPRYYDRLLEEEEAGAGHSPSASGPPPAKRGERLLQAKALRKSRARERRASVTPERLEAREEILRRQLTPRKF